MSFYLEETCNIPFDFAYAKLAEDVIAFCLSHENFPYEAEVNVILTDNEAIHQINNEYRKVDRPTDVLSFPMINYNTPSGFDELEEDMNSNPQDYFNPETGELVLGDIIISVEKVMEQAAKYGHSETRELAFLVAHSMMHLFGYDHMEADEAKVMEAKQKEVLDILNITR